jgi:predicted nuclease of predicted toxin-antitoxin system
VKLLLDEMYPAALATELRKNGIDAATVAELGLRGRPDHDVFAAAVAGGYTVLTENVGDFTAISGQFLTSGDHHSGVLIALSSRFSRRPAGRGQLVSAILALLGEPLDDRVISLQHVGEREPARRHPRTP